MAKKIKLKKAEIKRWKISEKNAKFGEMLKEGTLDAMQQLMGKGSTSINKVCQDLKRDECHKEFEKKTSVRNISKKINVKLETVRGYKNAFLKTR